MIGMTFDPRRLYEMIATMSGSVALSARAAGAHGSPVDDLTRRLRHPLRGALAHTVRAFLSSRRR